MTDSDNHETAIATEAKGSEKVSEKVSGEGKTPGIYLRGNTYWIAYHHNGRRIRESAHSIKKTDAKHLLKRRYGEAQSGRPVGPQIEKTALKSLTSMLLDDYRANSRRSLDRAEDAVTHLHRFFGEDQRAIDITADAIVAYQAQRRRELWKGKPVAAATINYEVAMLRRAFRLGARAGKVGVRPEFPMLNVDNARKGFFEPNQYRAVLDQLAHYLRPVAQAAYITGWRTQSELLTRQWRHVDLDARGGWLRLDPGESKNGEGRMFRLTPELRAILQAQRDHVRTIERSTGMIVPWVFPHDDGSPILDFRYSWAKACRLAGVPGRLVHDFRRTAVRNLERAGVPRSAAMAITGHRTATVYQRYAIVDEGMMREAADKLAILHRASAEASAPGATSSTTTGRVLPLTITR
jgi:integrase